MDATPSDTPIGESPTQGTMMESILANNEVVVGSAMSIDHRVDHSVTGGEGSPRKTRISKVEAQRLHDEMEHGKRSTDTGSPMHKGRPVRRVDSGAFSLAAGSVDAVLTSEEAEFLTHGPRFRPTHGVSDTAYLADAFDVVDLQWLTPVDYHTIKQMRKERLREMHFRATGPLQTPLLTDEEKLMFPKTARQQLERRLRENRSKGQGTAQWRYCAEPTNSTIPSPRGSNRVRLLVVPHSPRSSYVRAVSTTYMPQEPQTSRLPELGRGSESVEQYRRPRLPKLPRQVRRRSPEGAIMEPRSGVDSVDAEIVGWEGDGGHSQIPPQQKDTTAVVEPREPRPAPAAPRPPKEAKSTGRLPMPMRDSVVNKTTPATHGPPLPPEIRRHHLLNSPNKPLLSHAKEQTLYGHDSIHMTKAMRKWVNQRVPTDRTVRSGFRGFKLHAAVSKSDMVNRLRQYAADHESGRGTRSATGPMQHAPCGTVPMRTPRCGEGGGGLPALGKIQRRKLAAEAGVGQLHD